MASGDSCRSRSSEFPYAAVLSSSTFFLVSVTAGGNKTSLPFSLCAQSAAVLYQSLISSTSPSSALLTRLASELPRHWRTKLWHKLRREAKFGGDDDTCSYSVFRSLCDRGDAELTIELPEMLPGSTGHWAANVFVGISGEDAAVDAGWKAKKVLLNTGKVTENRKHYAFELAESTWKPVLTRFLRRFSQLRELTLGEFTDDDVLYLVGKNCLLLAKLTVKVDNLRGDGFRITNEGVEDFAEAQTDNQCLRVVDLSCCHSPGLTTKSVLCLSQLPGLLELSIPSVYIKEEDMLMEHEVQQSSNLEVLNVTLLAEPDWLKQKRQLCGLAELVRGGHLQRLSEIRLRGGVFPRVLLVDELMAQLGPFVKLLATRDTVKDLSRLSRILPRLETLLMTNPASDSLRFSSSQFANLRRVELRQDAFSFKFSDVCDVLTNVTQIREILCHSHRDICGASDKLLSDLLDKHSHLSRLTFFSLSSRHARVNLTGASVRKLLEKCPEMIRVQKLNRWKIAETDSIKVGEREYKFVYDTKRKSCDRFDFEDRRFCYR